MKETFAAIARMLMLVEADDFEFHRFSELLARFGLEEKWRKVHSE